MTTSIIPADTGWAQALISVFLMDSPAVIAAIVFFILLLLFENK